MMVMRWLTAGMLAAIPAFALPARAADDKEAAILDSLTSFGLRGVWSPDCYRLASKNNPRLYVNLSMQGLPILDTKVGTNLDSPHSTFIIQAARAVSPDKIELLLSSIGTDPGWDAEKTDIYQRVGNRMLLWRSVVSEASLSAQKDGVHDGVAVDKGMVAMAGFPDSFGISPLLERCIE